MPGQQRSVSLHKQGKGAGLYVQSTVMVAHIQRWGFLLCSSPSVMGNSVSAMCWWISWDGNWFQAPPLDFGLLQDRGDPKLQIHMTSDPEEQKWFIYRKGCSIFWVRSSSLLYDICCLQSKCPIAFMQTQLASSYWPSQKSLLLGHWSCYICRINFVLHFCALQY